jgi:hypothetical protein
MAATATSPSGQVPTTRSSQLTVRLLSCSFEGIRGSTSWANLADRAEPLTPLGKTTGKSAERIGATNSRFGVVTLVSVPVVPVSVVPVSVVPVSRRTGVGSTDLRSVV